MKNAKEKNIKSPKAISMTAFLNEIKSHCTELLSKSRCNSLPFHNIAHTLEVYKKSEVIANFEGLVKDDLEALLIASLFHDTGYIATYAGHECISATNAMLYLKQLGYPDDKIERVVTCINATKIEHEPNSILEKVICDADLAHLGDDDFMEKNERLRLEWSNHLNVHYTDEEWYRLNIRFLKNHQFYTEYGKRFLQPLKQKHLDYFEGKLGNLHQC